MLKTSLQYFTVLNTKAVNLVKGTRQSSQGCLRLNSDTFERLLGLRTIQSFGLSKLFLHLYGSILLVILLGVKLDGVYAQVQDRWTPLANSSSFDTFTINPVDTNIIYSGYYDGVAKSSDSGASWTLISFLNSDYVRFIAINPVNRDTLYVAFQSHEKCKSALMAKKI